MIRLRYSPLIVLLPLLGGSALGDDKASTSPAENRLAALEQLVRAGDDGKLLDLLQATASDGQIPVVNREQILFTFTQSLRQLPPGSIGPLTLTYLSNYESQAVVPHEDYPGSNVPLFNIRAATAGVQHGWRRQEARYAGAVLLAQDPAMLVQAYWLHADPPVRRGLLDALDGASPGQLEMISFMALNALEQEPEMAALAGTAALLNGDTRALEQVARTGSGSTVTEVLRRAGKTLAPGQIDRLLNGAIQNSRPEVAAVAIAELSPALQGQAKAEARLLRLLGDPKLGSSAALALATSPSDDTVSQLVELAESGDQTLSTSRARLALSLMRDRQASGVVP